jgi:hypothetical protein
MRIIAVLGVVLIAGCSVFLPAKPKFPEALPELTKPCPDLKKIDGDKVAITDLLRTVVDNYALYYDCSLKNDGWNDWYKKQKDIYDRVK